MKKKRNSESNVPRTKNEMFQEGRTWKLKMTTSLILTLRTCGSPRSMLLMTKMSYEGLKLCTKVTERFQKELEKQAWEDTVRKAAAKPPERIAEPSPQPQPKMCPKTQLDVGSVLQSVPQGSAKSFQEEVGLKESDRRKDVEVRFQGSELRPEVPKELGEAQILTRREEVERSKAEVVRDKAEHEVNFNEASCC